MRTEPPQQSPQTNNNYRTQNLYEASYLLAKGFNLAGKEKVGSKIILLFECKIGINEAAMGFYNGAKVEAKKFSDSYRSLKDYVFQR